MAKLCVIFQDQLSHKISSLSQVDKKQDMILMAEVNSEVTNVRHHQKKIVFWFSAMRHFANELETKGYKVRFVQIDDVENTHTLFGEVSRAVQEHHYSSIVITTPSEMRLLNEVESWHSRLNRPVDLLEDNRFLSTPAEFKQWADGRKQLRMEYFYRAMRVKHNILMDGDRPEGGKWNYDQENRKVPKAGLVVPDTYRSEPDTITQEVIEIVRNKYSDHFGDIDPFFLAVNRKQALIALRQFIDERLSLFGDYQDAMVEGQPWMYHAHIGFYLNCGLLVPMECIAEAEKAYINQKAPLNAVEGFIRQILGWREYVRGIYWLRMPAYEHLNFLNANRSLPSFYWTADTPMNCVKQCVKETKENAYAHHIQRLMVLGNFALIAGLSPKEVNEWYLIVYADAYQWVELPNVSGMVLYADGGDLASKPYAAGGGYINKMSNYCGQCKYSVSKKTGEDACPFNYLFWDFLSRNRDKLISNQRIRMMYNTYDRMSDERHAEIAADSQSFLNGC